MTFQIVPPASVDSSLVEVSSKQPERGGFCDKTLAERETVIRVERQQRKEAVEVCATNPPTTMNKPRSKNLALSVVQSDVRSCRQIANAERCEMS